MWAERSFFGRDLRSINHLIHRTINGIVSEQVHIGTVVRQRLLNRSLTYENMIKGLFILMSMDILFCHRQSSYTIGTRQVHE